MLSHFLLTVCHRMDDRRKLVWMSIATQFTFSCLTYETLTFDSKSISCWGVSKSSSMLQASIFIYHVRSNEICSLYCQHKYTRSKEFDIYSCLCINFDFSLHIEDEQYLYIPSMWYMRIIYIYIPCRSMTFFNCLHQ